MSEDFKVGDIVVCVGGSGRHVPIGSMDRVTEIEWFEAENSEDGTAGVGINLQTYPAPNEGCWAAEFFRKLPKADEDFALRVRACRPKTTVPA